MKCTYGILDNHVPRMARVVQVDDMVLGADTDARKSFYTARHINSMLKYAGGKAADTQHIGSHMLHGCTHIGLTSISVWPKLQ